MGIKHFFYWFKTNFGDQLKSLRKGERSNVDVDNLMIDMNGEETLQTKQAFERVAASHNVTVKHYHCDNGLFDSAIFNNNIVRSNQTISFCGVNAHHQNGKAERVIRDCTDGARTSLLHAAYR